MDHCGTLLTSLCICTRCWIFAFSVCAGMDDAAPKRSLNITGFQLWPCFHHTFLCCTGINNFSRSQEPGDGIKRQTEHHANAARYRSTRCSVAGAAPSPIEITLCLLRDRVGLTGCSMHPRQADTVRKGLRAGADPRVSRG